MLHVRGIFTNFSRERTSIFVTFFKRIFPAEIFLSNLSAKNDSRGVREHAPLENFENLHTVMAILLLFEQFLRKICHIFGP